MSRPFFAILSIFLFTAPFMGCNEALLKSADAPESEPTNSGSVLFKIVAGSGSSFSAIAKTADVEISAADMNSIKAMLEVTETSITGKVENIPVGKGRAFTVSVYDEDGLVQYRGSAEADIEAGKDVPVRITLTRVTGGAIINGTITESEAVPLKPVSDTYIRNDLAIRANDNYGCERDMHVGSHRQPTEGAPDAERALILFDFDGFFYPVEKAVLSLTIEGVEYYGDEKSFQLDIHRVGSEWVEGNGAEGISTPAEGCVNVDDAEGTAWEEIDENNVAQPVFDEDVYARVTIGDKAPVLPGDKISFDITELVNEWITGESENFGLLIRDTTGGESFKEVFFGARESELRDYPHTTVPGPVLEITP